jgi:hypothetical protein
MKSIDDAAAAHGSLDAAVEASKNAVDAATIGEAKKLLGVVDESQVKGVVYSALTGTTGPTKIRQLIDSLNGNVAAIEGLKSAGIKKILEKFTSASGSIRESSLLDFIKNNQDSLRILYGDSGLKTMNDFVGDIARSAKARSNVSVPVGSNTASMMLKKFLERPKNEGFLKNQTDWMQGQGMAELTSAPREAIKTILLGAGIKAGASIWDTVVNAGIAKISNLTERAMLDPKLASELMQKVMDGKSVSSGAVDLIYKLASSGILSINSTKGRKSGGRVGIDHEAIADKLIAAAERSKDNLGKTTEPLLDQPDDAIVKALDVANRSI